MNAKLFDVFDCAGSYLRVSLFGLITNQNCALPNTDHINEVVLKQTFHLITDLITAVIENDFLE